MKIYEKFMNLEEKLMLMYHQSKIINKQIDLQSIKTLI